MTDRPKVSTRPAGAENVRTVESSLDLILRAKAGDKTALDALYLRYLPRLSRWAHGRLPSSSRVMLATEDVVQEVLVKAVEHVDTFQPRHEGSFGHYVRFKSAGQFGAALAEVSGTQYRPDPLPIPRWKIAAAATATAAVLLGGLQVGRTFLRDSNRVAEGDRSGRQPATVPVINERVAPPHQILAAFYAERDDRDVKLAIGSALSLEEKVFLSVDVSRPVFIDVINRDDKNEWNLLFPLPDFEPHNPVPVGKARLPGSWHSQEYNWNVTSRGGREHLFVFVSPERMADFEQEIARLPRAEVDRPVDKVPLPEAAVLKLRGVGGLAPSGKPKTDFTLAELPDLPDVEQTTSGVWARQITFQNPVK